MADAAMAQASEIRRSVARPRLSHRRGRAQRDQLVEPGLRADATAAENWASVGPDRRPNA